MKATRNLRVKVSSQWSGSTSRSFSRIPGPEIRPLGTTTQRCERCNARNQSGAPFSSRVNNSPRYRADSSPATQNRRFSTSRPRPQAAPVTSNPTSTSLPLAGTLVVSLEQAIAGPFCTRQLADLGARVIKIERPGLGDFNRHHDTRVNGLCSHFVWTNRSKESLALDLKDPTDLAILKKIVAKADVLVQNLAPGATERMGLGYEQLKTHHPGLIVCDISGYGSTGPYKDKKAYDLLIQSESGFLSVTGSPDQPAKAGISIADIAAGTTAYNNILAALLARHKTGRGCRLDVSMLESMAEWMTFPLYYAYEGAPSLPLAGAEHASIYPYGPFATGGGGKVMLGMQNEREWGIFCHRVLEKAELTSDARFATTALRSRNRVALRGIIEEVFAAYSADEMLEKLHGAGIANAKVNTMADLWAHPQLEARDRWAEVETSKGKVRALKPAGAAEGLAARMEKVPEVGEHQEAILKEFGIEREGGIGVREESYHFGGRSKGGIYIVGVVLPLACPGQRSLSNYVSVIHDVRHIHQVRKLITSSNLSQID